MTEVLELGLVELVLSPRLLARPPPSVNKTVTASASVCITPSHPLHSISLSLEPRSDQSQSVRTVVELSSVCSKTTYELSVAADPGPGVLLEEPGYNYDQSTTLFTFGETGKIRS